MKNWRQACIRPEATIREAIAAIDSAAMQIALVVDAADHLLGVVTDGDVRRGILKGHALTAPVPLIMNTQPTVVHEDEPEEAVLVLMKQRRLHQIPVVDGAGRLVALKLLDELLQPERRSNLVVFMAGGLGTRLHPLTQDCPKPLLKVGSRPILETILLNFIEYGFHRFRFAVNYKAEMIEAHFGDGAQWGVEIEYVRERTRMGTAGALGLLRERPEEAFLVMNGDLLTRLNGEQLLRFHHEHGAAATMCVREYDVQIPYGVVETDAHRLLQIQEKPVQRYFVNAGIYVLEPDVLDLIPPDAYLDMPDLFTQLVRNGREVAAFPIREYWADIGQMDDFERANGEFSKVFDR